MEPKQEFQRRWLVRNTALARSFLDTYHSNDEDDVNDIRDWYYFRRDADPTRYQRIRYKVSRARPERASVNVVIKHPLERHLLEKRTVCGGMLTYGTFNEQVAGPPDVIKTRYELNSQMGSNRLHLDVFTGAHAGLMILEWNDPSPDADVQIREGIWAQAGLIEVTHSLTSAHVANLPDLRNPNDNLAQAMERLAPDMPIYVLTGSPASGKSTMLRALAEDPRFHVVPEIATILIAQLGIKPYGRAGKSEAFQRAVRQTQTQFEALARVEARTKGCEAVIVDRGTVDGAAYTTDGPEGFARLFGVSTLEEGRRYQGVIQLALPPRDVYEQQRGNNRARSEAYEDVLRLDQAIALAWREHAHLVYIDGASWENKQGRARQALEILIQKH